MWTMYNILGGIKKRLFIYEDAFHLKLYFYLNMYKYVNLDKTYHGKMLPGSSERKECLFFTTIWQ